jgi:hypothetical protein
MDARTAIYAYLRGRKTATGAMAVFDRLPLIDWCRRFKNRKAALAGGFDI